MLTRAHGFPKIERDSRLMLSKKITFSKRILKLLFYQISKMSKRRQIVYQFFQKYISTLTGLYYSIGVKMLKRKTF